MADSFESIGGAIKTANDWALSAYQINNQKAQTEAYLQQVEAQRAQVNQKIGEEMSNDMKSILSSPKGPYRKASIEGFKQKAKLMGVAISPQTEALLQDESLSDQVNQFLGTISDTNNPDGWNALRTQVGGDKILSYIREVNEKKLQQQTIQKFGSNPLTDMLSSLQSKGILGKYPALTKLAVLQGSDPRMAQTLAAQPQVQEEIAKANAELSGNIQRAEGIKQAGDIAQLQNTLAQGGDKVLDDAAKYGTFERFKDKLSTQDAYNARYGNDEEKKAARTKISVLNSQALKAMDEEKRRDAKTGDIPTIINQQRNDYKDVQKNYRQRLDAIRAIGELKGLEGTVLDAVRIGRVQSLAEGVQNAVREADQRFYGGNLTKLSDRLQSYINANVRENQLLTKPQINAIENMAKQLEVGLLEGYKNELKPILTNSKILTERDPKYGAQNVLDPEDLALVTGKKKLERPKFSSPKLEEAKVVIAGQPQKFSHLDQFKTPQAKEMFKSKGPEWAKQQLELFFKRPLQPAELKEIGL